MTAEIEELLSISSYAGSSVLLAQGAGGNTSVKSPDGRDMWVKASGYWLARVAEGRGYLKIDLPQLLRARESMAAEPDRSDDRFQEKVMTTVEPGACLRPSLETLFHAYLGRLVLHTHAVYANAFGCMEGGTEVLAGAIGGMIAIPYVMPGLALGDAVARACEESQPDAVLLENHGLITSGRSAAEAIAHTRRVLDVGLEFFGPLPEGCLTQHSSHPDVASWCATLTAEYERAGLKACARPATFRALADATAEADFYYGSGNLVPDDSIYNGGTVRIARNGIGAGEWLAQHVPERPVRLAVALEGRGVMFVGPNQESVESMEQGLLAHVLVRLLIARRGNARSLTSEHNQALLALSSEKYRQALLAKGVN